MSDSPELTRLLPIAAPTCHNRRILLFALRRIAAHGLDDAHAAHAMIGWFGLGFRRPLILLRALMSEMSRVSARKIVVAPCCCNRMTATEAGILSAVDSAIRDPQGAHDMLSDLLGVKHCLGALGSAQALSQAFEDLGHPFEREELH